MRNTSETAAALIADRWVLALGIGINHWVWIEAADMCTAIFVTRAHNAHVCEGNGNKKRLIGKQKQFISTLLLAVNELEIVFLWGDQFI